MVYKRKTVRKEHLGQLTSWHKERTRCFVRNPVLYFLPKSQCAESKGSAKISKDLGSSWNPYTIQILFAFRCAAITVDSARQVITALLNSFIFKSQSFLYDHGCLLCGADKPVPILWVWWQDQITGTENTSAPGCCVFKSSNTGYMVYSWPLRWWNRTSELRQLKDKEFIWAFISS